MLYLNSKCIFLSMHQYPLPKPPKSMQVRDPAKTALPKNLDVEAPHSGSTSGSHPPTSLPPDSGAFGRVRKSSPPSRFGASTWVDIGSRGAQGGSCGGAPNASKQRRDAFPRHTTTAPLAPLPQWAAAQHSRAQRERVALSPVREMSWECRAAFFIPRRK